MARLTSEYIRREFFRQFAKLTPEQKRGVIEGLLTIQDCMGEQAVLPLAEAEENDAGNG